MRKATEITDEDFANLMGWLSSEGDKADEKYEQIRRGLIRFFRIRGCFNAENLADEAINRVAVRLPELDLSENKPIIHIFYGFASNILLEYRTEQFQKASALQEFANRRLFEDFNDEDFACLESCLEKLSETKRKLVIDYYSQDKIAKISLRQELAQNAGLNTNNLHTKVHRIRAKLRNCIKNCLQKKKV